jgi:hypothetical protein
LQAHNHEDNFNCQPHTVLPYLFSPSTIPLPPLHPNPDLSPLQTADATVWLSDRAHAALVPGGGGGSFFAHAQQRGYNFLSPLEEEIEEGDDVFFTHGAKPWSRPCRCVAVKTVGRTQDTVVDSGASKTADIPRVAWS